MGCWIHRQPASSDRSDQPIGADMARFFRFRFSQVAMQRSSAMLWRRLKTPSALAIAITALASLVATPVFSQYSEGAGIETVGSASIHTLRIAKTIFEGECPGETQYPITGYFVNDDLPPRPGLTLKLTNMSRGLSPDDPPFTNRTYDRGRASQSFDIALGERHRGRYFVVREGRNLMQYEIFQAGNTVSTGTFTVRVDVPIRYQYRGKKAVQVTKYNSDGTSYKATEYRCS